MLQKIIAEIAKHDTLLQENSPKIHLYFCENGMNGLFFKCIVTTNACSDRFHWLVAPVVHQNSKLFVYTLLRQFALFELQSKCLLSHLQLLSHLCLIFPPNPMKNS